VLWRTRLHIANPTPRPVRVHLEAYQSNGVPSDVGYEKDIASRHKEAVFLGAYVRYPVHAATPAGWDLEGWFRLWATGPVVPLAVLGWAAGSSWVEYPVPIYPLRIVETTADAAPVSPPEAHPG